MIKKWSVAYLMLSLSTSVFSQLYVDRSNDLPRNGSWDQSMDVVAVDLDNDEDLDLVLANEFEVNSILLNDGFGNFTKKINAGLSAINHDSEDIALGDFNEDGLLDLIICSEDDVKFNRTRVHEYYLGLGNATFRAASYQFPDSEANAVAALDANGDQHLDVIFGNNGINTLFMGKGDGSFEKASLTEFPSPVRTTQDLQVVDVDGDGDYDIFEGNENGNALMINDGQGNFSDESNSRLPSLPLAETRKASFADIDGDGDLDAFLSNVAFRPGKNRRNIILINNGLGVFEIGGSIADYNEDTLDGIFEDIDNDGVPDLIMANVNLNQSGLQRLFKNDGNGNFDEVTQQWLPSAYGGNILGVISADLNGDKSNDLYWCDRGGQDIFLVKKNLTSISNQKNEIEIWLNDKKISFQEEGTLSISNTSGQVLKKYQIHHNDRILLGLPDGIYFLTIGAQTIKTRITSP